MLYRILNKILGVTAEELILDAAKKDSYIYPEPLGLTKLEFNQALIKLEALGKIAYHSSYWRGGAVVELMRS
jgi:hypothetical protein